MMSFNLRENVCEVEFAHRRSPGVRSGGASGKAACALGAERLGTTGQAGEAYAVEMVAADVASPTPDTVLGHIVSDLAGTVSEQGVRRAMDRFWAQADASIRGAA